MAMDTTSYRVDRYVVDTLMADLVAHDRRPSAFLAYLAILAASSDSGRCALSHSELAQRTGLSKRSVQAAVAALERRGLVRISRRGPTEIAGYQPLSPWRH